MRQIFLGVFFSIFATHVVHAGQKLVDGFWVTKSVEGYAIITKEDDVTNGRWDIDCSIDKMVDKRKCVLYGAYGAPVLRYDFDKDPNSVCINAHNFPDRTAMVRIDKNEPITTDAKGCISASAIMPQIKAGKVFLSRWYKWPNDQPIDTETQLMGLSIAIKTVAEIQDNNLE
ncbi:hypothetical protein G6L07_08460 [Agrobacterium rhizogenes]|nr:hypothetical protein [Rhizobium rhizogenes]